MLFTRACREQCKSNGHIYNYVDIITINDVLFTLVAAVGMPHRRRFLLSVFDVLVVTMFLKGNADQDLP